MKYYFIVIVFILLSCSNENKETFHLPIYTPNDLDPNWIDSSLHGSKSSHFVPEFSFTNQLGNIIDSEAVKGKIIAVNYFFTTCPSICPTLTENMKRIQEKFLNDMDIMILSHTVYPEHDSPSVLNAYADLYDIRSEKWYLLTGDKRKIYDMARKGHFALKGDSSDDLDAFIHTENFVLVDQKSRIRGFYNGTNPHDVNRMIEDIFLLKKETPTF